LGMRLAHRAQGHLDGFVHHIFHARIMLRRISLEDTAWGDSTRQGASGPPSTRGPGGQKTFDGMPLGGHATMDLASIKLPLLARDRAPVSLLVRAVCMRTTLMITHRSRQAIQTVD
jgi:hypothetical protein